MLSEWQAVKFSWTVMKRVCSLSCFVVFCVLKEHNYSHSLCASLRNFLSCMKYGWDL